MGQCLIQGILACNTFVSLYVVSRQYRLLGCPQPSVSKEYLSPDDYAKASAYSKTKCFHHMCVTFLSLLKDLAVLGMLPWLYSKYIQGLYKPDSLLLVVYYLINTVADIPAELYFDFIIERAFGFNNKTPLTFLKDTALSVVIGSILTFVVGSISVAFLSCKLEYFYIYWWLCLCLIQLVLAIVFPNYIAPLYNTFTPLPDGPLRTGVEELARRVGFSVSKIMVMDGSKRSGHSNAYFTGLGKMKQIVLYDTIINQLSTEEVLGVLCHELGHWSHSHFFILMPFGFSVLFVILFVFSKLIALYKDAAPSLQLIYLMYLSGGIMLPLTLTQNLLVRVLERQADRFAVKLECGAVLKSALIKLGIENKSAPVSDPVYSALHYTHPSLDERLVLIDAEMNKNK